MALGGGGRARRQAAEMAEWQAQRTRVQSFLDRVRTFAGATNADGPILPLQLLEGEHALLVLPAVELIEPRRLPGHFMGGDGGFTFEVARNPSDEEPPAIDTGVVTVTDQRVVFSGSLHTRTWEYGAVIGYHSHPHPPWTAIAVADRQRIGGVRCDPAHAEEFRFALALGLARYHQAEASLTDDLLRQLEELDRDRPAGLPASGAGAASPPIPTGASVPEPLGSPTGLGGPTTATPHWAAPVPVAARSAAVAAPSWVPAPSTPTRAVDPRPGSSVPPPGWYPDPYRRARVRWWDGRAWTGHAAP